MDRTGIPVLSTLCCWRSTVVNRPWPLLQTISAIQYCNTVLTLVYNLVTYLNRNIQHEAPQKKVQLHILCLCAFNLMRLGTKRAYNRGQIFIFRNGSSQGRPQTFFIGGGDYSSSQVLHEIPSYSILVGKGLKMHHSSSLTFTSEMLNLNSSIESYDSKQRRIQGGAVLWVLEHPRGI